MLIIKADQAPETGVNVPGVRNVTMRIVLGRKDNVPNFALRHFTLGKGGHSPHHKHNYEHEAYIVSGSGRLEFEGESHSLSAGDVVYIEPNAMHQFINTGEDDFCFLCIIPLEAEDGSPTPGS